MKISRVEFIPHRLKRKVRWQTASYSVDSLQVFYLRLHSDTGLIGLGGASIVQGVEVTDGSIRVPDGLGLGMSLNA